MFRRYKVPFIILRPPLFILPEPLPYDEAALLLQVAAGDEKAFAQLYRLYVPQLTPFVLGITKSEAMVNEMIQEAFLRLWMNRDKLYEVRSPKAWIFKITANICYTYLRRLLVDRKVKDIILMQSAAEDVSTEQNMHVKALVETIREAVNQLTPQRKKIYLMSREQGMTLAEICSELGLSMSTVKNTLTTSLQLIREHLLKQGYTISLVCAVLAIIK